MWEAGKILGLDAPLRRAAGFPLGIEDLDGGGGVGMAASHVGWLARVLLAGPATLCVDGGTAAASLLLALACLELQGSMGRIR